jgi:hypothetical protein
LLRSNWRMQLSRHSTEQNCSKRQLLRINPKGRPQPGLLQRFFMTRPPHSSGVFRE